MATFEKLNFFFFLVKGTVLTVYSKKVFYLEFAYLTNFKGTVIG